MDSGLYHLTWCYSVGNGRRLIPSDLVLFCGEWTQAYTIWLGVILWGMDAGLYHLTWCYSVGNGRRLIPSDLVLFCGEWTQVYTIWLGVILGDFHGQALRVKQKVYLPLSKYLYSWRDDLLISYNLFSGFVLFGLPFSFLLICLSQSEDQKRSFHQLTCKWKCSRN